MKSLIRTAARLSRRQKQLTQVMLDALALPVLVQMSYSLRLDVWQMTVRQDTGVYVASILLALGLLAGTGIYKTVVRAFDESFLKSLVQAVAGYAVGLLLLGATGLIGFLPRSVPFISAFLLFLYVWGSRALVRYLIRRHVLGHRPARRVMIYGAGSSGQQVLAALVSSGQFRPVGFLDDARQLKNTVLAGLRVYPGKRAEQVIRQLQVTDVLLAMPAASRAARKQIIERLEPLGVHIRSLPSMDALMAGKVSLGDIQEVDIADLLGRDPVAPRMDLFRRDIAGLTVMVSGAGGSIGAELCRQILRAGPSRLVLLEQSEYALYAIDQELRAAFPGIEIVPALGSVLERERLERLMRRQQVATVYHAAAYKHVPLVEANPFEGVRNNTLGTHAAACAAVAAGVKTFVLISTDKAVRPTNVMGASKRLAELSLQALAQSQTGTRFCMVRFGNVLGSSGSVVPLFRRQIAAGGPLTVTHAEVTRYFMTIPEAAQLVIQAGAMGQGGDVFVLDMGEPVRIVDLARQMLRLSGLTERTTEHPEGDIEIVVTGLRPGEKLYEELLIASSAVESTDHPRILKAFERAMPLALYETLLEELALLAERRDSAGLKALLGEQVEGYVADIKAEDVTA